MRSLGEVTKPSHKKIAESFTASLLSNTKWRKLLAALSRPSLQLKQVILKLIDRDDELLVDMPNGISLHPPSAYVEISIGPVAIKAIEWIEIPAAADKSFPAPRGGGRVPRHHAQDIEKVKIAIESVGQLSLEETNRGLRIIGHVRKA